MSAVATKPKRRPPVRLTERAVARANRVDRENGILFGVKVLGEESRNGRIYLWQAMQRAVRLYDGAPVKVEHRRMGRKDDLIGDTIGSIRSPRLEKDGIYGDVHLLPSHPKTEFILDSAEQVPGSLGLSHDAEGRIEKQHGRDVVVEIFGINSVDFVANPATTSGLFESGGDGKPQSGNEYPEDHAGFIAQLKSPVVAPVARNLSESVKRRPLKPLDCYPSTHAGFVTQLKRVDRSERLNGVPKRPSRQLLEGMSPDKKTKDFLKDPPDGQLAEILEILNDENLTAEQKVDRIQAYVDEKRGVQESFVTKLKRGTWRR